MASSMTIPTASVSPSSVIEFRLKSSIRMKVNVVMMDVGMAIELISTIRQSRMKSQTMNEASKLPSNKVLFQRGYRRLDVGRLLLDDVDLHAGGQRAC